MAWSTPRTWTTGELVTAAHMNQEVRDNLNAIVPNGPNAWTAWTPTLTNLTQGNGTLVTRYVKVGRLIVWRFGFILGTTSAVGSVPTFSLPVTSAGGAGDPIGNARLRDTGTADYRGLIVLSSTTAAVIKVNNAAGTYLSEADLTATVPHTWASTDVILAHGAYESAS